MVGSPAIGIFRLKKKSILLQNSSKLREHRPGQMFSAMSSQRFFRAPYVSEVARIVSPAFSFSDRTMVFTPGQVNNDIFLLKNLKATQLAW